MKARKLVTALSTITLTISMAVPAMAATTPTYHFERANVIVNGSTTLRGATKFVANKTTYMSVYDVQLLINKLIGTTNKNGDNWMGSQHDWNITDTKASAKAISGSYGNTVFKINGQVVMNAPILVAQPHGDPQPTAFAPIWYVQQVINELVGTNSKADVWDGAVNPAKWTLTTINPGGPMIPSQGSGSQVGSGSTQTGSGQTATNSTGGLTFKTHDGGTGSSKGAGTTSTPANAPVTGFNQ